MAGKIRSNEEQLRANELEKITKQISRLQKLGEQYREFSSIDFLELLSGDSDIKFPVQTKEDLRSLSVLIQETLKAAAQEADRQRENLKLFKRKEKVRLGEEMRRLREEQLEQAKKLKVFEDHLADIRSKGSVRRLFVAKPYRGEYLSNDPKTLESLVADLHMQIEQSSSLIESIKSEINQMAQVTEQMALGIEPISTEHERALLACKTLIPLIPKRFENSLEEIPTLVAANLQELNSRYNEVEKGELDQKLAKRAESQHQRDIVKKNREKQAKRDLALRERKDAEKFLRLNASAEKESADLLKEVGRIDRLISRSEEKVIALEKRRDVILRELWVRHAHSVRKILDLKGQGVRYMRIERPNDFLVIPEHFPSLNRVLNQINDMQLDLERYRSEQARLTKKVEKTKEILRRKKASEAILRKPMPAGLPSDKRPKKVVTTWKHAEELARDFFVYLGFHDARLTGDGADGGVDVISSRALGQVKMHSKGVGRPDVQGLVGVASVERKIPIFFAMMYTSDAVNWAERAKVALFRFERSGEIGAVTEAASLLESRTPRG